MKPIQFSRPYFSVRRLLLPELSAALALYAAAPRESAWTLADSPEALMRHAKFWGGFFGTALCICGGLCEMQAPLAPAQALCNTQLELGDALLLPVAATAQGEQYANVFLEVLLAQAQQESAKPRARNVCALLPVKTGAALAPAYFEAGFSLLAIRPLHELRPTYIFMQTEMKNEKKESIIVSFADTYLLAKQLEQGYLGTALVDGTIQLQRMEHP